VNCYLLPIRGIREIRGHFGFSQHGWACYMKPESPRMAPDGTDFELLCANLNWIRQTGEEVRIHRRRQRTTHLKARSKSGPAKLTLAARMRFATTLTIGSLARRLHMGSRKALSNKLRHWNKTHENRP